MIYVLAAFAFGFFLCATVSAFPDNGSFARTDMMAETNYLWIIYLAIGIGIIFVGAMLRWNLASGETRAGKRINQRRT